MKIQDFELYKELLYDKSGLVITPDKSYLLDSRLTPIAKKWDYPTIDAMTIALRSFPDQSLIKDIIEAMTTNETSFYRDMKPFYYFENVILPYLKETKSATRKIKIWCAAASSGQEPYTLAMLLKECAPKMPGWTFEIRATDISDEILDNAKKGLYTQFEVQRGLPITHLMKYFTQAEDKWQINDDVKSMIKFENFNLLKSMAGLGSFDVIFCRNVLIYFDDKTKNEVLTKMANLLPNDGFVILGGAETVLGICDKFVPLDNARGLYVKPNSPAKEAAKNIKPYA